MINPYTLSPTYENEDFLLRQVTLEDAQELLSCYADDKAFPIFNSDNCNSNFSYKTLEAMQASIRYWLKEYTCQYYVRFAIVSKTLSQAIGTIEIFNRGQLAAYKNVGMLRIDVRSDFEKTEILSSLLNLISREMPKDFGLEYLLTKAIPEASQRIDALTTRGYKAVPDRSLLPYSDYYLKSVQESSVENMGYCGLVCESSVFDLLKKHD